MVVPSASLAVKLALEKATSCGMPAGAENSEVLLAGSSRTRPSTGGTSVGKRSVAVITIDWPRVSSAVAGMPLAVQRPATQVLTVPLTGKPAASVVTSSSKRKVMPSGRSAKYSMRKLVLGRVAMLQAVVVAPLPLLNPGATQAGSGTPAPVHTVGWFWP